MKVITLLLLLTSLALAQSQEPGQAEARETTRPTTKLAWTHPASEMRGIWLSSREMMLSEPELTKKLDAIRDGNFNVVLLDSWFRGFAAFDGSDVAPRYKDLPADRFGWIIDQCQQRGLAVHAWPEYGFYAYHTPDVSKDSSPGPVLTKHPELNAINSKGEKYITNKQFGSFYSMCPSNPLSHEQLATVIVDSLKKFPKLTGVNLDRIRYPDVDFCFCDYCKTHFKADTGVDLKPFADGSPEAKQFLDWRREQTAVAVATIVKAIRAERPAIVVTAYVVGPFEMDSKAQGWDLWMKRGLLDAIAVSMYGADIEKAANRALELLGPAGSKLLCAVNADHPTDVYTTNLQIGRGYARLGAFTWWAGPIEKHVDALKAGPYASKAQLPLPAQVP